jgi:hypothetical protein
MEHELPPLQDVLGKLPWFTELTRDHRATLLGEITERLVYETSRDEFTELLLRWSQIAHQDSKWRRFSQLRNSGLLGEAAA